MKTISQLLKGIKFCDRKWTDKNFINAVTGDVFDNRIMSVSAYITRLDPRTRAATTKFFDKLLKMENDAKGMVHQARIVNNTRLNVLGRIFDRSVFNHDFEINNYSRRLGQMIIDRHPEIEYRKYSKKEKTKARININTDTNPIETPIPNTQEHLREIANMIREAYTRFVFPRPEEPNTER